MGRMTRAKLHAPVPSSPMTAIARPRSGQRPGLTARWPGLTARWPGRLHSDDGDDAAGRRAA